MKRKFVIRLSNNNLNKIIRTNTILNKIWTNEGIGL